MYLTQKTVARKILMGVTGIFLLLFIVGHMLGNTTIFGGQGSLNSYAHHIHSLGPLIWLERIFLSAVAVVHIGFGILLTLENRQARPAGYVKRHYVRSTVFSRTMIYSGLVVLAFVVFHLFHFTFRVTHPEISRLIDAAGRHDVYSMVVLSFQKGAISLIYIAGLLALLFHLSHGVLSLFQTMGWNSDRFISVIDMAGKGAAIVLFIGFIAVPVSILLGFLNS